MALNFGLTCLKKSSMYITPWSSKYIDCEKSAKGSSAHRRPWETQLEQNKTAFSMGCHTHEARGSNAYMKQNAITSVGYNRNHEEFGQNNGTWKKKMDNQFNLKHRETTNGIHEECEEFGRMFREKLQEFAMILTKKYHYNFSAEYFDDYRESFNKEEFLKVE